MTCKSFFLGVDGGGSKTTAVVADEYGNILGQAVGESINYYSVGLERARENMLAVISELAKLTGSTHFRGVFIGMSALNDKASNEELEAFSSGVIDADFIGMDSDLYIAIEAMLTNKPCAVVISGTGSMVTARDENGEIHHAGGWGYILGDEGSGYDIAIKGIRHAIRAYEGSLDETLLTDALPEFYSQNSMEALIDIFYDPPMPRKKIADFSRRVRELAAQGDSVSKKIIIGAADDLALTALTLLQNFDCDFRIGLWGGIFQHSEQFRARFIEIMSINGYNAGLLCFSPEIGAIFSAYKLCNIVINDESINNLRRCQK